MEETRNVVDEVVEVMETLPEGTDVMITTNSESALPAESKGGEVLLGLALVGGTALVGGAVWAGRKIWKKFHKPKDEAVVTDEDVEVVAESEAVPVTETEDDKSVEPEKKAKKDK